MTSEKDSCIACAPHRRHSIGTPPRLPPWPELDPVDLVSADYRFALLNAVCVLSHNEIMEDDELVPRAKELLELVDDDICRTYRKEKDARAASEVPHE